LKISVTLKVFSVALVLILLVGAVAWVNARSAREVKSLITNVPATYVPIYGDLARANLRAVEEGLFVRRLIIARLLTPGESEAMAGLESLTNEKGSQADAELAHARHLIALAIADPASFEDKLQLGRLDTRVEFLQKRHAELLKVVAAADAAIEAGDVEGGKSKLQEMDQLRDVFDGELDFARRETLMLLDNSARTAVDAQSTAAKYGLLLLGLALALGLVMTAIIAVGLVRPLRRLLRGTIDVQQGALEIEVPVTSRDEIGDLTVGFNAMVKELKAKARIRETFGRYVDPRIVANLIDQPERLGGAGERREMSVLFCDMKGFTALSEGMTPAGMVRIVNRYLSLMSDPIHRNKGIIDKYMGDGIMAYWGPPFTLADDQADLACAAGLEQLAALPTLCAELPEITGLRRGIPPVEIRIGVATGEVLVGNIGSDSSISYTVMGDTVNFASLLEGANKAYDTRFLVGARTADLAANSIVFREIDLLLVKGKQEPQQAFEVLGRQGEVAAAVLTMAERFAEGLAAYRRRAWRDAEAAFRAALEVVPDDGPSKVFLSRVLRLATDPPSADWIGVWELREK